MRKLIFIFFSIFTYFYLLMPKYVHGDVADTATDKSSQIFIDVAKEFGLWAALCVVLLIFISVTTWFREKRMAKRIDELETMVNALSANHTKCMERNHQLLGDAIKVSAETSKSVNDLKTIMLMKYVKSEEK